MIEGGKTAKLERLFEQASPTLIFLWVRVTELPRSLGAWQFFCLNRAAAALIRQTTSSDFPLAAASRLALISKPRIRISETRYSQTISAMSVPTAP